MAQQQLERINDKLQQLVAAYGLLQRENEQLRNQNTEYTETIALHTNRIHALEQTVAVLRTLSSSMGEGDKKEIEKRISQYLKDIDRCINMLSSS